jgi:hypothetical protein
MLPDSDIRLVPPEQVTLLAENRALFPDTGDEPIPVLHETGSEQLGSLYGASALEPFVAFLGQRDVLAWTLYMSRAWQIWGTVPADSLDHAIRMEPFARRGIAQVEDRISAVLGEATKNILTPPANLYFPGQNRMKPAASRFVTGGRN